MARVANRHLSGTLATPNRLLRFPVVTTEPPTHVDVVSALSIACHEEIFIFPFFFLFLRKYSCMTLVFFAMETYPSKGWLSANRLFEIVNFSPNPFLLFLFHFFFLLVWRMYTDFKKLQNSKLRLNLPRNYRGFRVERDQEWLFCFNDEIFLNKVEFNRDFSSRISREYEGIIIIMRRRNNIFGISWWCTRTLIIWKRKFLFIIQ